jgi:hypothetical protein
MDAGPLVIAGEAKPRRLRIVTRYATVADFVRGFAKAVDRDHVLVAMSKSHPFDSMWLFEICLADGEMAFGGIGRLVEILPERDPHGRIATRLRLMWLGRESKAMHEALLRARRGSDLARGTGGPFRTTVLPLPAPPLAGYDEGEDDDGIDAATQLYGRQHLLKLPLSLPLVAPPADVAPTPTPAPAPAQVAAPAVAIAPEPEAWPDLELGSATLEPTLGARAWLVALALVVASAAAAFSLVAYWH